MGPIACTSLPQDPEERREAMEVNDPLEPLNRQIFAVNQAIDVILLRPVAVVYRDVMPDGGKRIVNNFVTNLKLPFTIVNDLLQGETSRAGSATVRFVLNTTFGIAGLFDMATSRGYPYHEEDFGQTLAVWGVGDGPYLVLPLIGPSNFRDGVGLGAQYFGDPVSIAGRATDNDDWLWGRVGLDAVNTRYQFLGPLDQLERTSLDFYAAMRSLYRQRRADAISNGRARFEESRLMPASPADEPEWSLRKRSDADVASGTNSGYSLRESQGLDYLRDKLRAAVNPSAPQLGAR